MNPGPIGLFDSGLGGVTVLRELRAALPNEPIVYLADQARCPYGDRDEQTLRGFARQCVDYLIGAGAKLMVVACNTASAAALESLRAEWPGFPFVGMVPAVKPAVLETRTGVVGVLATPTTMQGKLLRDVLASWRTDSVLVIERIGAGLVELVEAGAWDTPEARQLLASHLAPLLAAGADRVVLGCTHYPLLTPLIRELAPSLAIEDAGPAVARQAARLLAAHDLVHPTGDAGVRCFTTGDSTVFAARLRALGVPDDAAVQHVQLDR